MNGMKELLKEIEGATEDVTPQIEEAFKLAESNPMPKSESEKLMRTVFKKLKDGAEKRGDTKTLESLKEKEESIIKEVLEKRGHECLLINHSKLEETPKDRFPVTIDVILVKDKHIVGNVGYVQISYEDWNELNNVHYSNEETPKSEEITKRLLNTYTPINNLGERKSTLNLHK
jgi:hypothetical protein